MASHRVRTLRRGGDVVLLRRSGEVCSELVDERDEALRPAFNVKINSARKVQAQMSGGMS